MSSARPTQALAFARKSRPRNGSLPPGAGYKRHKAGPSAAYTAGLAPAATQPSVRPPARPSGSRRALRLLSAALKTAGSFPSGRRRNARPGSPGPTYGLPPGRCARPRPARRGPKGRRRYLVVFLSDPVGEGEHPPAPALEGGTSREPDFFRPPRIVLSLHDAHSSTIRSPRRCPLLMLWTPSFSSNGSPPSYTRALGAP